MTDKEFFTKEDSAHHAQYVASRRSGSWLFVGLDEPDANRAGYVYLPSADELAGC